MATYSLTAGDLKKCWRVVGVWRSVTIWKQFGMGQTDIHSFIGLRSGLSWLEMTQLLMNWENKSTRSLALILWRTVNAVKIPKLQVTAVISFSSPYSRKCSGQSDAVKITGYRCHGRQSRPEKQQQRNNQSLSRNDLQSSGEEEDFCSVDLVEEIPT